jgi:two-component system, LytTR family, sensor histidine kinase AlgZ
LHPILARTERLASYLGASLIVAVLLAAVLTRQGLTAPQALALLLPIVLVYSTMCLSAWYVCRATPLRTSGVLRVLASSALAALIASGLWLGLARAWIALLSALPAFAPAVPKYQEQVPFLFAVGVLLYLLALAVHYLLLAFETARAAERRQLQLEVLTRDAQLRALRAQLDPHFLYNSLNSISAMTTSDPAGARRMCLLLGDFLRDTLKVNARERISLADELALADRFLTIEQVRFGARLQVERRIDAAATQCRVPPLLLQPLVENAVTHGIAGLLEGGVIRLNVVRDNGRLSIAIENPRDADAPVRPPRGMGLENVRQRLGAMFGGGATLETRAETRRYRVELDLPCLTDD